MLTKPVFWSKLRLSQRQIVSANDFVNETSIPFADEGSIKGSKNTNNDDDASSRSSMNGCLRLAVTTNDGFDRTVPNCCAVCLESYDVGDHVVWSTNKSCHHAFHEECVTDWLVKMQGDHPCPCCRQVFIDTVGEKKTKKKTVNWAPGPSMDLSAISL